MFPFAWFSSGQDQAAIGLLTAAPDYIKRGLLPGRLARPLTLLGKIASQKTSFKTDGDQGPGRGVRPPAR